MTDFFNRYGTFSRFKNNSKCFRFSWNVVTTWSAIAFNDAIRAYTYLESFFFAKQVLVSEDAVEDIIAVTWTGLYKASHRKTKSLRSTYVFAGKAVTKYDNSFPPDQTADLEIVI